MTEAQGRAVLKHRFEAAGLTIQEDVKLDDPPVTADGWDAARKIGYEFITSEAGDRAEFTPGAMAELERRMEAGELTLLLVDEHDVGGEDALARAADLFLAELKKRGRLP